MSRILQAPARGTKFYVPNHLNPNWCSRYVWHGDGIDYLWLERKLMFTTKKEAISATRKLIRSLED